MSTTETYKRNKNEVIIPRYNSASRNVIGFSTWNMTMRTKSSKYGVFSLCCLVIELGLGLGLRLYLVSGWLVVTHAYLYYSLL